MAYGLRILSDSVLRNMYRPEEIQMRRAWFAICIAIVASVALCIPGIALADDHADFASQTQTGNSDLEAVDKEAPIDGNDVGPDSVDTIEPGSSDVQSDAEERFLEQTASDEGHCDTGEVVTGTTDEELPVAIDGEQQADEPNGSAESPLASLEDADNAKAGIGASGEGAKTDSYTDTLRDDANTAKTADPAHKAVPAKS
ncbi:MAG: hypothetical protein Q4C36_10145, partial [Coriobacteriia bacterium]|nr:hypothetical protein [Coriobacteriia bacterium]